MGGGITCCDRTKFRCKWNVEAVFGGAGPKLSPIEFTRATSAKRLQREGNPLLVRACSTRFSRLPAQLCKICVHMAKLCADVEASVTL